MARSRLSASCNCTGGRKLLIIDGHSNHIYANFVGRRAGHGVDLVVLPLHTSHITQPLDVSIFGPLKTFLTHSTLAHVRYNRGRINKTDWLGLMAEAWSKAMIEQNIKIGWRLTGLWPYNRSRLLKPLPPFSTPPPDALLPPETPHMPMQSSRQLTRTPLVSLTSENRAFLAPSTNTIPTPIKRCWTELCNTVD
jgi:hypothetical protein